MKKQLNEFETKSYEFDLWRIKCALSRKFGSQKKAAEVLGIDEANLSRVLSGLVDCSCRTYWQIFQYAGFTLLHNV